MSDEPMPGCPGCGPYSDHCCGQSADYERALRERIATEIETAGDAAQVEYDKCEAFHALSPMTCSRLSEARFFARLVRRGEQQ